MQTRSGTIPPVTGTAGQRAKCCRWRLSSTLLVFCLALASTSALAQIYRVIDDDGNVSFTDRPPAGAEAAGTEQVEVDETVQNRSMSVDAIEQEQPEWLKDAIEKRKAEEAAEKAAAPGPAEMRAWRNKVKQAKNELRNAREAQKRGVIASEGDFIGKAGGGVRPSQQYFEKLRQLDQDVAAAEQKLEQLRRAKPGG